MTPLTNISYKANKKKNRKAMPKIVRLTFSCGMLINPYKPKDTPNNVAPLTIWTLYKLSKKYMIFPFIFNSFQVILKVLE